MSCSIVAPLPKRLIRNRHAAILTEGFSCIPALRLTNYTLVGNP
ncbi:MAG: hypothetical protein WC156_15870 [Pedobacter sp.]